MKPSGQIPISICGQTVYGRTLAGPFASTESTIDLPATSAAAVCQYATIPGHHDGDLWTTDGLARLFPIVATEGSPALLVFVGPPAITIKLMAISSDGRQAARFNSRLLSQNGHRKDESWWPLRRCLDQYMMCANVRPIRFKFANDLLRELGNTAKVQEGMQRSLVRRAKVPLCWNRCWVMRARHPERLVPTDVWWLACARRGEWTRKAGMAANRGRLPTSTRRRDAVQ